MYRLNMTELVSGNIHGHQGEPLTQQDVLNIARTAPSETMAKIWRDFADGKETDLTTTKGN